jgi:hypothetical protein
MNETAGYKNKFSPFISLAERSLNHIVLQDVLTGLKSLTQWGRPNWDKIFAHVAKRHNRTQRCVVYVTD